MDVANVSFTERSRLYSDFLWILIFAVLEIDL